MNRITFRLCIALLTFAVGVSAVSLWFFFRRNEGKKIESKQMKKLVARKDKDEEKSQEIPKVKWLYINDPIEWSKCAWAKCAYGYITIFYENGDWARVYVSISKDKETKNKLLLMFSDGQCGTEIGKWEKKNDDTIRITIERCRCILCEAEYDPTNDFDGEEPKILLPIVESWKIKNETIGQKRIAVLESPVEKYWLKEKDNFLRPEDLDDVISARYLVWKDYKSLGEPCSKFPRYRNLFNTKR